MLEDEVRVALGMEGLVAPARPPEARGVLLLQEREETGVAALARHERGTQLVPVRLELLVPAVAPHRRQAAVEVRVALEVAEAVVEVGPPVRAPGHGQVRM